MARLRYNGLTAELGADLLTADTTITFTAALTSAAGAVPTITGTDYIPLAVLGTDGGVVEIIHLTAYTTGATTGTVTRAQESTAAADHATGLTVVNGLTVADVNELAGLNGIRFARSRYTAGTITLTSTTMVPVNNTTSGDVAVSIPAVAGDLIELGLDCQAGDNVANWMDFNAATYVGGSEVNRVGGTGTTGAIASWGIRESNFWPQSARAYYTVQAGDISGGQVQFKLLYRRGSGSNRALFSTTSSPLDFTAKNLGTPIP